MTHRVKILPELFREAVSRAPHGPAYHYFDGRLSYLELDRQSDALAACFQVLGIRHGGRVMICLQNVPAVILALVACAKIGAIAVLANPMYRERELGGLIEDSDPTIVICHKDTAAEVIRPIVSGVAGTTIKNVLVVSSRDRQSRDDPWIAAEDRPFASRVGERLFEEALAEYAGRTPETAMIQPDDIAMLVYTSGTTGKPKGAMISHANMCSATQFYHDWTGLRDGEGVLALAPLFHVTGLSGHIFLAISAAAPLVLSYRFEPRVMLESIAEHKPIFAIGAITALTALTNHPGFAKEKLASLRVLFSGGAPIPPAIHQAFFDRTGLSICNVYGLTETSGPITASPRGASIPVDPASGAMSIGIPVNDARISFRYDDDAEVGQGQAGELVVQGPGVVVGYWNKPPETSAAINALGFHTGDVAFRDAAGWIYLVDRKKDMINASGYKVWPREVEDVLYTHPAVREAAVIGVQDPYRGETVRAVISLKPDYVCEPPEIVDYCRSRLAAYKYPRQVVIVDELPKTTTGKIMKALLREQAAASRA